MKRALLLVLTVVMFGIVNAENPLMRQAPTDTFIDRIKVLNAQLKQAASSDTVYKQIAYRNDFYYPVDHVWMGDDSGTYAFNNMLVDTQDIVYQFGFQSQSWGLDTIKKYQLNAHNLIASVLTQHWANGAWVNTSLKIINYDANDSIANYYTQDWDLPNSQWVNKTNIIYTYDARGNKVETLYQMWDLSNNRWYNNYREYFYFDAHNNLINVLSQHLDTLTNNWINNFNDIRTYDSLNNLSSLTSRRWDMSNNTWLNNARLFYWYTGILMDSLVSQSVDLNNNFLNQTKYIFYYTAGNETSNLIQVWDDTLGSWVKSGKDDITYNASNQVLVANGYFWDAADSAYVQSSQVINAYDNNGNIVRREIFGWDVSSPNPYNPETLYTYQYDAHNNNTYMQEEDYDITVGHYVPAYQHFYYYQAFTLTGIQETENISNISISPNPVIGGEVMLHFSLAKPATITANIFDNSGRLVATKNSDGIEGNNIVRLGTGNLSAGIYYVQYIDTYNHQTASLKLIVE